MSDTAALSVAIGADLSGLEAGLAQMQREVEGAARTLTSLGQTLSVVVTAPLTLLAGAAVKTAADMQALEKGFAATYKGAEPLSVALGKVQQLAKLPGLGLKEALEGATNLQAAGFSAEQARKSLQAFGNAIATVGKGKAELDRVSLALTQINNTPFVQGQDLNQLRQTLPQIGEAMKKAFGVTNAEGLKSLGVTSKQFIATITDEFAKLPAVTGGLKNALENLSDTGTLALASLGDALSKAFNLEGLSDGIGSFVRGAVEAFNSLSPGVQKAIFGLAGFAAAVGPILAGIGAIGVALPALEAGFAALGIVSVEALAPILPVAAAVAAAAYLIYENWDSIRAYFSPSGEGGRLFSELAKAVETAVSDIVAAFEQLRGLGDDSLGGLISASDLLKFAVRELAVGFTSLANVVGGVVGAISSLFRGDFTAALADAKRALFGLVDPLANVFGFTKKVSFDEFFGLGKAAQSAGDAVRQLGPQAEKAKAELSDAAKEMAKALAAVEKSLRTVNNESLALGDAYDYLGSRQGAVEAGIKRLIGAGFAPGSVAVQRLVRELKELNQVLGDNTQLATRAAKGTEHLFDTPEFKLNTPAKIAPPEVLPLDLSGLQVDAEGLSDAYANMVAATEAGGKGLTAAQERILDRQRDFNANIEALTEQLNSSVGPLIADFASQFGDALGSILTGASDFGDAAQVLFGGILQSLGTFMGDFGKQLVAIGIGKLALDTLFSGPQGGPLAIAAGLGLIALAGVVSAVGKSAAASVKNIGSGGSAVSRPASVSTSSAGSSGSGVSLPSEITLRLRGQDAVAVLRLNDYRSSRTG